ncbi:MAG: putative hydroxymethylpyrimidine transporter CytX [Clostridia bacterium]|nr:putative hydroxymethylpyrimidine transporter CytX [Clostridia bacterium]MDD4798938.1 putative hydroxymethylpyrimidine transporter CytX [Clostridia bacterium]
MDNKNEKTTVLSNGLLWFAAACSLAEIITGALFAPLGMAKGTAAILSGHLIGCYLLYLMALIGAKQRQCSMEIAGRSFGRSGSNFFALLNILQLVGWTAVMIISGARAVSQLFSGGENLWALVIGGLIILWVLLGLRRLGKLHLPVCALLLILSLVLAVVVFKSGALPAGAAGGLSFGAALELSIAMPLSWLPLVADYTRHSARPQASAAVSAAAYFGGSCLMYFIGLAAACYAGTSDVVQIMLAAGLGLCGLLIVVLSTVTTTFLDVWSAGVCSHHLFSFIDEKKAAVTACLVGLVLAVFVPMEQYENFLYLIGSVFAPMAAVVMADYFFCAKYQTEAKLEITAFICWLAGFVLYRVLLGFDLPCGSTLPVMAVVVLLRCLLMSKKRD